MLNQSGIYQIRNTVNGKVYVGSSKCLGRRWRVHKNDLAKNSHHSLVLQRAWNKYGAESFVFEPILICAPADRIWYEQRCLDHLKPAYNISTSASSPDGRIVAEANRRRVLTDEARQKLRNRQRGKVSTANAERLGALNRGKNLSPETRAKLVEAWKSRPPITETTRAKLRESRQGRGVKLEYEGRTLTIKEWSQLIGVSDRLIRRRLAQGFTLANVLSSEDLRSSRGKN